MKRGNTQKVLLTYLMYLLVALGVVTNSFFACRAYNLLVLFNFLCVSATFFFVFIFKNKIQERPIWSLLVMELLLLLISFGTAVILIMTVDVPKTPKGEASSSSTGTRSSQKEDRIEVAGSYGRTMRVDTAKNKGKRASICSDAVVSEASFQRLGATQPSGTSVQELAQAASDKNQVMDELLNQDQIPTDYGTQMVALFRDKEHDVLTRDFAVQHIGLYAQALQRRGVYDSASAEAHTLRAALDEASTDTKTIIAAAAFRALADLSEFDPHVDTRRLDARLAACLGDASAAPAARVMAAHLCGERRVAAARATLSALADDPATPTPLRLAARNAIEAWSAP